MDSATDIEACCRSRMQQLAHSAHPPTRPPLIQEQRKNQIMPSNRSTAVMDVDMTSCLFDDSESVLTIDAPIVFILDARGNIRFVNDAGERLCGYSQRELQRMNITQIITSDAATLSRQQLRRSIRQRFGTVYEVEVVTKHGESVMLEISIDLVRDSAHALEIHGIALQPKRAEQRFTPRCLDERFVFSL